MTEQVSHYEGSVKITDSVGWTDGEDTDITIKIVDGLQEGTIDLVVEGWSDEGLTAMMHFANVNVESLDRLITTLIQTRNKVRAMGHRL